MLGKGHHSTRVKDERATYVLLSVHTVVNEAYANDITIMLMGKMQNGQDQNS